MLIKKEFSLVLLVIVFCLFSCLSTGDKKGDDSIESASQLSEEGTTKATIPAWADDEFGFGGSEKDKDHKFSSPISLYPAITKSLVAGSPQIERNDKILIAPFWVYSNKDSHTQYDITFSKILDEQTNANSDEDYFVINSSTIRERLQSINFSSKQFSSLQYISGMVGANIYLEFLLNEERLSFEAQAVDTFSGEILVKKEEQIIGEGLIQGDDFLSFYHALLSDAVKAYQEIRAYGDYFQVIISGISSAEAKKWENSIKDSFNVLMRNEFSDDNLIIGGYGKQDSVQVEKLIFAASEMILADDKHLRLDHQDAYSYSYIVESLGLYEEN